MKSFFFLFLPLQGLIMGFLKWLAQLKRLGFFLPLLYVFFNTCLSVRLRAFT